ncbi:hypothetical protein SEA_CHRIS_2 [Mycobacterium phage Chris]|uniref:Uncharacterized protein n=1 Tax=Mycobacterium phage Chris TaxID=2725626 RepID=A0A6M3SWP3_9CAUD|nr:hypothetical protein I5G96_gp002 [Mycobacterium phage Chris]QJD50405.1 hypothetical protein SEA_CHRIS_2 [Mycobacterium phage Chris]
MRRRVPRVKAPEVPAEKPKPRVGVVANVYDRAREVIAELGIGNAVPISQRVGARGFCLDVLLLDESCLPLSDHAIGEIMPTVMGSQLGHIYELRRV